MPHNSAAHGRPPTAIKEIYKAYQKWSPNSATDIIDLNETRANDHDLLARSDSQLLPAELRKSMLEFLDPSESSIDMMIFYEPPNVYAVSSIPGLLIYPSLLPKEIQIALLEKLFHRDLCNSEHQTNVHLHHHVPTPGHGSGSYFDQGSCDLTFEPKDPAVHKSFKTQQFLDRKLRWMTLGGQYDWTNKVYPSAPPPTFPPDIKHLIESIFPMKAEAAIVNLYSPGDTLSLHRDISEECDQPLVSISIGCDGIFVIGIDGSDGKGDPRAATIRLRSGDAVLMSGKSRFAWHGVPKVLERTCPEWLQDWPFHPADDENDSGGRFEHWKGWMKGKRVNLNVRQMFA